MLNIKLNERISFRICRSKEQQCVVCGNHVYLQPCISMNNSTDELVLKKNIWMHITCVPGFAKLVKANYKRHEKQMVLEMI